MTDSDEFISLPSSAQALYMHLNLSADDDGFNNQVQLAMLKAHASVDDVKILLLKRFIIQFESGVIVIKHWRMSNALRKDRYTPTAYQEEFKRLNIKDNGAYSVEDNWLPNGCQMVAVGKDSIDKYSIGKERGKFTPPTLEELTKYCAEKGYTFDPESFINYYNSNGWKVGRNPMKNWRSAVANWAKREKDFAPKRKTDVMPEYMNNSVDQPAEEHTAEDIERMLKEL